MFVFVLCWIFSGWPRVWQSPSFPPQPPAAQAAVATVYATSYSADGSLTGWTNPAYAYTDDGTQFATRTGSAKNTWYGTLYGFNLSAIPDNALINSVTITAEWKNSAADSSGPVLLVGALSGGAEVGSGVTDASGQTAFELVNYSPAGLSATDLKAVGAGGFWAILRFRRTDNTGHTASVDYVKVAVDYTLASSPAVSTQAISSVEAATAVCNGNITATGGAEVTARGCEWDTDSGAPYANRAEDAGSFGTGAFTKDLGSLPAGTAIYARAFATNFAGTGYGSEAVFLTKPAPPANVAAADGSYADKVAVTWTKSVGATGYHVWRDGIDLGSAGDAAGFDDVAAAAPTITPGSAVASDGTSSAQVDLSLPGALANNGPAHSYKVVAYNATGNSADSSADTGYRGVGALSYQWQRSAGDSDAGYSDISGATAAAYGDTGAPADGSGRYYRAILNAPGAAQQASVADRGFRAVVSSISLLTNGSIVFSVRAPSSTTDTTASGIFDVETIQVDGGPANLDIRSTNFSDGSNAWALNTSHGADQVKWEYSLDGAVWHTFTQADTNYTLDSNVAQGQTRNIYFRLTMPSSTASFAPHDVTVTIIASPP